MGPKPIGAGAARFVRSDSGLTLQAGAATVSLATSRCAAGFRSILYPLLSVVVLAGASGCAGVRTNQSVGSGHLHLPEPDMLVGFNFASTSREVTPDKGPVPKALRADGPVSDEEQAVGHMVADRLAQALVQELRGAGINAVRNGPDVRPTAKTGFVHAEFLKIAQGNQDARVWIGFGVGSSQVKTRIQMVQACGRGRDIDYEQRQARDADEPRCRGRQRRRGGRGGVDRCKRGARGHGGRAKRAAKEVGRKIKQGYIARGRL